MALCVTNVIWTQGRQNPDGTAEGVPELEVTDGWYRLRAEVDAPLARAIRRGAIRIGRKIGVVNAKACDCRVRTLRLTDRHPASFGAQGTLGNPRSLRQRQTLSFREFHPFSAVARQTRLQEVR